MNITLENNNCLICGSALISSNHRDNILRKECPNECTLIYFVDDIFFDINIFHKTLFKPSEIEEEINYWKTNDRYLIRLMEGKK